MTKFEYLSKLMELLSDLDSSQIESSVQYYSEMIDDRIEDGLSEEEAVNAVGLPEEAAEKIRNDAPFSEQGQLPTAKSSPEPEKKVKNKKEYGVFVWILIILGFPIWGSILIGLVSVIFSAYCVLWSVVVSVWAVFASTIVSGVYFSLYSMIAFATVGAADGLICLGGGLTLIGLALFILKGCIYATKGAVYLSKLIPCSIIKLFERRRKNDEQ